MLKDPDIIAEIEMGDCHCAIDLFIANQVLIALLALELFSTTQKGILVFSILLIQ